MKPAKKPMSFKNRNALIGYAFLAPWLIGVLVFVAYPFFYSIFLSFTEVSLSNGIQTTFVGMRWYREAFTADTEFITDLLDTLKFVVMSTPMIVIASLIIALLLNGKYRGRLFFRGLFFFPVIITSGPVISELLTNNAANIVRPEKYVVYAFISTLPAVLSVPLLYVFDNIVLILWFSGVQILVYLSGLQKIGPSVHEAAAIDGASAWQVFWKIILPFIKPMILVNAVYTLVELSAFSGNAINRQFTPEKMTAHGKVYGYASALSWIYFLCVFALLGIVFLLLRERMGRKKG